MRQLVITFLSIVACGFFACEIKADEQADLERMLARIGLHELQIVHLEDTLQSQTTRERQVETARTLSDAYIAALLAAADDEERFSDYAQRVRDLTKQFREIDSPSLQTMMLQADYMRAEKLIAVWLEDRSRTEELRQAHAILDPVLPKLEEMRKTLMQTIDRLYGELGADESETLDAIREERIDTLTQVSFRATYFSGWAHYYWAVAQPASLETAAAFKKARDAFGEILALDTETDYLDEMNSDWIPLKSIWVARSLLGLGVAEAGLQQNSRNDACFDLLSHPFVNKDLRRQAGFWHLQSWLNVNNLEVAEKLANKLLADELLSDEQIAGVCLALTRTGFSKQPADDQERDRLQRISQLGLRGMMQLRRFPQARELVEKYQVELNDTDFYSAWLKGFDQFVMSEKTRSQSGYESAAASIQRAVTMSTASNDVKSLAVCRYHLAWVQFRLEKFDLVDKLLQQAIPALKSIDVDLAMKGSWLRFESINELARKDEAYRPIAINILEIIIRDYPGTQVAKNAEYQLARVKRGSTPPAEVLRDLESITADNPNYLSARYEICLLWHQMWQEVHSDPEQANERKRKATEAIDRFLNESGNDRHDQRLRATLIAVDINLRSEPSDIAQAVRYLATAEQIEPQVSSTSSTVIEYHYHRFQIARVQNRMDDAIAEAAWLTENGNGTAYQKSAVIQIARTADDAVENSKNKTERDEAIRNAVEVYEQMVALFGDTEKQLKNDKNARVALSRLASYQIELGMFQKSATNMEKLVHTFPTDQNYLRKLGTALFHAGAYEDSLPHWRKLCDGLESGSESWFEARYHLIFSLAKTDAESAKQVYSQFKKLYPDPGEVWREKFESLANMIGQ